MEKFNRTLRGYDPDEVNAFLDEIISRVEKMVDDIDTKNEKIKSLEKELEESSALKEKVEQYERMEETLNKAIFMAQKTSDQLKVAAHRESEIILDDAKKNASRIVNEALMRAERIESESANAKRNVTILKRRLKNIIESQLEVIDEIDELDI